MSVYEIALIVSLALYGTTMVAAIWAAIHFGYKACKKYYEYNK